MANGGGPDHHDDRKNVEKKEPKRVAQKQGATQSKKPESVK